MSVKSIILPSGVEAGITRMQGKHTRILTETKNLKNNAGVETVLADCIAYLGNDSTPKNQEFVKGMLSADREFLLFSIRQHSYMEPKRFLFNYEWPLENENKSRTEHIVQLSAENFPLKPYGFVTPNEDGSLPVVFESYNEMLSAKGSYTIELPLSGSIAHCIAMNGYQEISFTNKDRNKISDHDFIKMRNVRVSKDGGEPVMVNLDKLEPMDYLTLRNGIKDYEGKFETSVKIQTNEGKSAVVNLLGLSDFFFPSTLQ